MLHRPNLVTKSALVEQAYSLAKYEIDQLTKYDAIFGERATAVSGRLTPVGETTKERILRHHSKILAAKRGNSKASGPSPQLVAALRHVYGENESLELWSLLQSVMDHSAFAKEENLSNTTTESTDIRNKGAYRLESLISKLCQNDDGAAKLHGLLITVLSLVTSYQVNDDSNIETKEQPDPSIPPPLQVGSILSVIRLNEDDRNPWSLDTELLAYLGEAAAVYEERIEIQKERLLSKLDDSVRDQPETTKLDAHSERSHNTCLVSNLRVDSPAATPQPVETPDIDVDAVAMDEEISDMQQEIEEAAAALSAAMFQRIISSAEGEESSEDGGESSESGSDHDSEYEETGQQGLENLSESSSSSSSSSERETGGDTQQIDPHDDSEDEDNDQEEEDGGIDDEIILRQALALSLTEQPHSLRVDTASLETDGARESPFLSPGPITPGSDTPVSKKEASPIADLDEESPLPVIPLPPKVYPYPHLLDSNIDSDQVEKTSPYFEPASLNRFGTLPAPHVLMHLLRFTLETIERRKFQGHEESTAIVRDDVVRSTIVGGMGASLFPSNHPFFKSQRAAQDTGNEIALSLQMLVSLFLLNNDRRSDAIGKLQIAVERERRAMDSEGNEAKRDKVARTPTSDEGDDPAIALALHYLEDAESKESLEAKGMLRKAAAAAHDAAALLESLRRRTASWKHQVEFFSQCTLISMKCLHVFLQYVLRRWLLERQSLSPVECHDLLPKTVISKFVSALDTYFTPNTVAAEATPPIVEDAEETFLSLRLYQGALLLWGEAVPLTFPTVALQTEVLQALLAECSNSTPGNRDTYFEKLTTVPSTILEFSFHKLQILCRRLRVSDLLDSFVSSPACYLPEERVESSDADQKRVANKLPDRPSSLIRSIGNLSKTLGGLSGELQSLYLALCHKCHVRILMWDGLYACSESELEDPVLSSSTLSTDSVRVNSTLSDSLVFDGTKCSDSMSIIPNQGESGQSSLTNGSAVNQRASKVWGTVLSSTSFSPKTGVHRWAVRLDKCERGHVFIGVSTSQASTRTYVGGDKYGWGMIGTQALWHDRRKIRGDYGATFRTGSIIIVTLDTDAGSLSFSAWKDGLSSSSFALDSVLQNSSSPRRQAVVGGTIEDWGIAFEGLPLDSRLFPAVGLYQRDDRVSLLTVESGHPASSQDPAVDLAGSLCYFPRVVDNSGGTFNAQLTNVHSFNDILSWDGIEYATRMLEDVVHSLEEGIIDPLHSIILQSLSSALCLIPPSIPVLSQRFALSLLPRLTNCLRQMEHIPIELKEQRLFANRLQEGKWVIRATGSSASSSDSEEYIVDFASVTNEDGIIIGFEGTGVGTTGKSKNGLVAIFGSLKGSSIHFVEEWSDGNEENFGILLSDEASSSCVVNARLSLDGKKFEGHYRNVQFGTTGQIAGILQSDDRQVSKFRMKEPPMPSALGNSMSDTIVSGKTLLCLAHSHLSCMLAEDAAADFSQPMAQPDDTAKTLVEWKSRYVELKNTLRLPFLALASTGSNDSIISAQMQIIRKLYAPPVQISLTSDDDAHFASWEGAIKQSIGLHEEQFFSADVGILPAVSAMDERTKAFVGGNGSLAVLAPIEYESARMAIIRALIHHCNLQDKFLGSHPEIPDEVQQIWVAAKKIMEDGVRSAIALNDNDISLKEKARHRCLLCKEAAEFLVSLEIRRDDSFDVQSVITDVSFFLAVLQSSLDMEVVKHEMRKSTQRGILRFIAIHETLSLVREYSNKECITTVEALSTGIPRILGRGFLHLPSGIEYQCDLTDKAELGGHYLLNLPGLSGVVSWAIRRSVHALWASLIEILELTFAKIRLSSLHDHMMDHSMMIALFASFTTSMRKEDVTFVVQKTPLISLVISALDYHRDIATAILPKSEDDSTAKLLLELDDIGHRDVSRSVVRVVIGLSHLLTYQALAAHRYDPSLISCVSSCLDMVLQELEKGAPIVHESFVRSMESYHLRLGDDQWQKWLKEVSKGIPLKTPSKNVRRFRRQVGRSGVNFLHDSGISYVTTSQGSIQKPHTRNRGSQHSFSKVGADNDSKQVNDFSDQVLTHWIHTIVAVSKSPMGRKIVSGNSQWMRALFALIGLSAQPEKGRSVPARYRGRIIRILLSFLELQKPSAETVTCLFHLAGKTNLIFSNNHDEDEGMVSRETVSLLRHLHSPDRLEWRAMINDSISTILSKTLDTDETFALKSGVILFFNGTIEGINRGTFVLLKPAAATTLVAEQQTSPSSKGHNGASGGGASFNPTPHHVVGNGTEGIISGLCREDSSAGIVSSIDTKNGLCEVILLNRDSKEVSEGTSSFRRKIQSPAVRGSSSSRYTLTVRAVRSPLSDIAHAQEVGLYLDESVVVVEVFAKVLMEAIELRSSINVECDVAKGGDMTRIKSELLRASYSAMVLKCALSALSDDRILARLLKSQSPQDVLSKVLDVASCLDRARDVKMVNLISLASLPVHEARWVYLTNLLRGLFLRTEAINRGPECTWDRRFEELKVRWEATATTVISNSNGSDTLDGYTTPPIESVAAHAPPILETGARNPSSSTNEGESGARSMSQSTTTNENSEEDDDSDANTTAVAHLREAAIAQMAELGLPRSWSELALRRTGGTNIEAAVHFCLERGGEMERLLLEERERERMVQRQTSAGSSARRRGNRIDNVGSSHLLRQLMEMGFPSRWCAEALAATGNNVDEALTWILTNGERLSAEDAGMEDGEDDVDLRADADDNESDDDEDSQEHEHSDNAIAPGVMDETKGNEISSIDRAAEGSAANETQAWTGSIIPLRFISGRSIVDPKTLSISGLPTGGFSSVGTKGVLLTSGKWYYEAILETAGCLQIGWADGSFAGHCHADRGDGCGDGPSSWAYDGWRRYRWHATATEWGCRWAEGDVIGCMVDMDEKVVSFTLNGRGEEIGMGVAFSGQGFRPCGGVYACVSFNRREKLRIILGGSGSEPFKYPPPPGYAGVGEAVLAAVSERELLVSKEDILEEPVDTIKDETQSKSKTEKKFLCDFSDGEHGHELMAWAHRYYGSDASVHLGSGKNKTGGMEKIGSSSSSADSITVTQCLNRRIESEWQKRVQPTEETSIENKASIVTSINEGYTAVALGIREQVINECYTLSALYARKLILHMMVMRGDEFDPNFVFSSDMPKSRSALRLWKVIEASASLRSVGWIGEAGAMAIAAEALGLGISSNDNLGLSNCQNYSSLSTFDEGITIAGAGIVQVLSSIFEARTEGEAIATSCNFVASAEAALGSEGGGGVLVFLRKGLQGAICRSTELRDIVIASVRRSVRLLAVVEHDGEDSVMSDKPDDDDIISGGAKSTEETGLPTIYADARLVSYMTGLLLCPQVELEVMDHDDIKIALVEAWSVGLLSASLPWRMVCAFTASGILNSFPQSLTSIVEQYPTLSRYYSRLLSTVSRRIWAERAASPICSRYAQAMIELLCSVKRAVNLATLPDTFMRNWKVIAVDAATPIPLPDGHFCDSYVGWESDEGWVLSDTSHEIWTGTVSILPVAWKTPSRSAVRTLMDGGDGPPMLREGCIVMRGIDWSNGSNDEEDGKDIYEIEKEKKEAEKHVVVNEDVGEDADSAGIQKGERSTVSTEENEKDPPQPDVCQGDVTKKSKKKKVASPKLPIGTVLSIEPWNGVPAMARRVRWHLTGKVGLYRYGGDGGRYDISHVEVNEKGTRVRKRHPLPESAEQCAARHGFGLEQRYSVLLRVKKGQTQISVTDTESFPGIMEWPDFGAAVRVNCTEHSDGLVTIEEEELIYGSKDSGWEARFGHPCFVPGSVMTLNPVESTGATEQSEIDCKTPFMSLYEELVGTHIYFVPHLRNKEDGGQLSVTSELRLLRARGYSAARRDSSSSASLIQAPLPPPISFDRDFHAPSLALSRDGRTVSCVSSDGRGTAFASTGFTKGVHYWEVKLEQADVGSVFIGVAEKPSGNASGSSSGHDIPPRLNRWHGWGFVNFRATYTAGAERIYGAHCHAGDTVGVLLDCDAGRLSFFFDGLKYGEHILNDLGCAFENLSPFGFNVDGCGGGGAGQGAPSAVEGGRTGRYPAQGAVRPKALWPVIGLRNQGDRVTISSKWNSTYGTDGVSVVKNVMALDDVMELYTKRSQHIDPQSRTPFPKWFIAEAFSEYQRWRSASWCRSVTRGSGPFELPSCGLNMDLNCSPLACASASALLGLNHALLSGDRVRLKRSAGRILELAEEAVVLGAYHGRLYYRIVSQKSEGGSLTEGGGRAWCWDESEVVEGVPTIGKPRGLGIPLPLMDRFRCTSRGGLKVVYEGGAVVRSDLEIFEGSLNLGSIPANSILPCKDVLERRVNSCGVVRYRVRFGELEGWISSMIRGGKEEAIVVPIFDSNEEGIDSEGESFHTPMQCALKWYESYRKESRSDATEQDFNIDDMDSFKSLLEKGVITGLSMASSDAFLSRAIGMISDVCDAGNPLEVSFNQLASAISFAVAAKSEQTFPQGRGSAEINQVAASAFSNLNSEIPPVDAIMARVAVLRAFNRRLIIALPWLSLRPSQEGSAMFGGVYGHGTSIERAGRSSNLALRSQWVQVPSIASKIRSLRDLFFTSVKKGFLRSITDSTTTPTPLSHDEYELPREIRTVRLNRLKARRVMAGNEKGSKRKHCVFAQLHNETKSWGGAALRRGFVAKGHGGQKRAFKVKLIGEGVNDYSGPYREAFTDSLAELLSVDIGGQGSLAVLDPTPNGVAQIGENRGLYMFSLNGCDLSKTYHKKPHLAREEQNLRDSYSSLIISRDEASREVEESLVFLGRITGTAFRHGIPLDLPLPLESVWKAIVEEPSDWIKRLQELDTLAYRHCNEIEGTKSLIVWQQRMLNAFVEGLSNVLPVEILSLLSGEELRDAICGNPEVDVDLLRRVVEYEGYEESDKVIQFFWETLREFTNDERKAFLQFVWARNRLPMKEHDFEAPFKIQKDSGKKGGEQALPSASTCFFSLTLPEYSTKEQLKQKLLFAINNVTTMETDFQTNSAEIAEGYRSF